MNVLEVTVNKHQMPSSSDNHKSFPAHSTNAQASARTPSRAPAAIEVRGARVHNLRNMKGITFQYFFGTKRAVKILKRL